MKIEVVNGASLFSEDSGADEAAHGPDFEYATCSNEFTMKRGQPSGLLYLDPRPADSSFSTIYPSTYEPYRFDELPAIVKAARDFVQSGKAKLIRRLVSDGARILDVGCGNGALLKLLRSKGSASWQLHANDINADGLRSLQAEGFTIHPGRVEELVVGEPFDLVILNQVIEHLADVRSVLRGISRILRPGGAILIETPSSDGLDARAFSGRHWGGYHFPRHFFIFDQRLLVRLLAEEGFEVSSVTYLASPAFWIQSIHHLLADHGHGRAARLFTVRNPILLAMFAFFDTAVAAMGGRTSNMRVTASRR